MSPTEELVLEILGTDGRTLPLPAQGRVVVGSSDEHADLILVGQGVDPAHCTIGRLRDGGWAVKDLGSEYGTHVNGTRVASRRLAPGDLLVLGSRRIRVLDANAAAHAPETPAEPPRASEQETRRVGGYRIERLIGRGRGGLVYLAVQESLHRPVALKLLDPALAADADFVGRFRSEARAAAALNHPNVVVVHDVGEQDGKHYLSMEYVPGGSLEDEVASSGRLPWRRVLDVLHDAAGALDYAEKRGIVHRDVKPANLMRATGGSIKLADLGLATTIQSADGDERIFGTPHFISPEQARGEAVDHRSDLYSLGATAYRLLTGRTVFDGADTPAIVRAHFSEEPTPPRHHVPELPVELEALVLRLLAKQPDQRPASARVVLDELARLRAAADSAQWADGQDPRRSTRRLVGLLAGSVLGAAALFAGLLFVARRIAPAVEDDGPGPAVVQSPSTAQGPASEDGFFDPAGAEGDPYAAVETRLERLDREAREAFDALDDELTREERRDALLALTRRFSGTETAERAKAEITRLESALATERERESLLAGEAAAAGEALRRVAGWPPTPKDRRTLRASMAAIRSYRPPRAVGDHASYEDAREALEAEIAEAALQAVREGLQEADALAESGSFEAVGTHLDELVRLYTPPAFVGGEPLPFAKTRLLLEEASARRGSLPDDRARWLVIATVRDRGRLARAIDADFVADLRQLDLDALEARIAALDDEVRSESGAAFVAGLRQDVQDARAALELLASELRAGSWRRHSVVDVHDGRGTVTVAAAVPGGLILEGTDRTPVPWSRFAARAEWMHQLFHQRLKRDYTPDERTHVSSLLRLTAVGEAAAAARDALHAGRAADDAVVEPFLVCPTCSDQDDTGRSQAERQAAEGVRRATRAAAEETWSATVATLETLLDEAGGSLLLCALSDGSSTDD